METFRTVVSWLVAGIGLVGWTVFVPQIRLLLKEKEAKSISLGLIWGSFAMQTLMFTHALLQNDWHLAFAMFTSLSCLVIVLALIYYYRKYPGGRKSS